MSRISWKTWLALGVAVGYGRGTSWPARLAYVGIGVLLAWVLGLTGCALPDEIPLLPDAAPTPDAISLEADDRDPASWHWTLGCDLESRTYWTDETTGVTLLMRDWYAEVGANGRFNPTTTSITARYCNPVVLGKVQDCPDGRVCVHEGYTPPDTCYDASLSLSLSPTRLSVYCGNQWLIQQAPDIEWTNLGGVRYGTVWVEVRR